MKTEVQNTISELVNLLDKYQDEQTKINKLMTNRHDKTQKNLMRLSILYFVLHLLVCYALIYQIYGWDTIEPITYIVGNVYWIIAIGFFIKYKRKLDVNYFISDSFTTRFYNKQFQRFSFNRKGYDYTHKYLRNLKEFRETIGKI